MAYSRDLPKMAVWHYGLKLQYGMVWFCWYGVGGGQITSELIHEEISIMDCNGLS